VDTGIGPPCPVHLHCCPGDPGQSLLQGLLNTGAVTLPLPPAEVGTVVGNAKADVTLLHDSREEGRTHQGAGLIKAVHQVHILHGLTRGPFGDIING